MLPLVKMCLEAKSASLLLIPAMDNFIKGDTFSAFMARANNLVNFVALGNFDDSLRTHPTLGVLSHKMTMVLCFIGTFDDTMRKAATCPSTFSSKLLMFFFTLNLNF